MTPQQLDYRKFRVLLDEPTSKPALGFDDYALAFADIILESEPQFAIGIFGDWGSGKTTLMKAVLSELLKPDRDKGGDESPSSVIPVWFNAWRYEREEHLIVPMLDTLREGLADWAKLQRNRRAERQKAYRAAATVGRAARALVAGFAVKATIAPVEVQFDPKRVMDMWSDERQVATTPLSFYHATFNAMKQAVRDVVDDGRRRVVIFIDDLDRCLPANALEVLESMKLFFDLEGFVFVVGLDQNVIERSIESKYQSPRPWTADAARFVDAVRLAAGDAGTLSERRNGEGGVITRAAHVSGAEYVKKIFQVPFSLPRISTTDLRRFFESLAGDGALPVEQSTDLEEVVWPHLDAATGTDSGSVNPREVKRLINAYTLQMKMLSAKLLVKPNPDVVLAIQTMAFRSDWRDLYELLAADPQLFVVEVKAVLDDPQGATEFSLRAEPLPTTFLAYVGTDGPAHPLLEEPSLDVYITSAETTGSSSPVIAEARSIVARLKRTLGAFAPGSLVTEPAVIGTLSPRLSLRRTSCPAIRREVGMPSRRAGWLPRSTRPPASAGSRSLLLNLFSG